MAERVKKRSEIREQDTWKLEDMIASPEKFEELADGVEERIPGYETYRGKLGSSADLLKSYLEFDESMDETISLLYAYAMQKRDQDTSVSENQALVSRVQSLAVKAMAASSFAQPEILEIPDETMNGFLETDELKAYKLQIERLLAKKPHMLSEKEEAILASASEIAHTPSSVFSLFNNADLKFDPVEDENGELVEVTHARYGKLIESKKRSVREAAFHSLYKGYRQFANTIAATYEGNVKQGNFYARMRQYPSARAMYLAENEIPERVYDNLLESVHDALPLLHRYMGFRKKCLDLPELHMYDLYVPLTDEYEKTYSYKEAQELILKALKPLGEEYLNLLKNGFGNRWIDVYENEGKRSGAYSNCVYGVHPYVLMSFDGTLDSVLTLAHEMGHSIHSWYSNANQTYTYAGYKIFVAEVASTCNEILILNYMINETKDRKEKFYLINQLAERFRTTLFRQAMFADFEAETYRLSWSGTPLTKDLLCSLYHELNSEYYGEETVIDEDIDHEWERIPHFYMQFYVYQYATGFSAAMAIARRILSGDEKTKEGYFRFLKGGCSKTPVELLKLVGLDMEKPDVVNEAMKVFEGLIKELEGSFS